MKELALVVSSWISWIREVWDGESKISRITKNKKSIGANSHYIWISHVLNDRLEVSFCYLIHELTIGYLLIKTCVICTASNCSTTE